MTQSKRDTAYEFIRERIVMGQYRPGDLLDEQTLARENGVSRTPIREATRRLVEEGLVQVLPRRGILVSRISLKSINDMMEARYLIEPFLLRKGFHLLNAGRLAEFRDHEQSKIVTGDARVEQSVEDFDTTLHLYLTGAGDNDYLNDTMRRLMTQNQRMRAITSSLSSERVLESCHEHVAILDKAIDDDLDGAVEALRTHLRRSRESYDRLGDFNHEYFSL
ncbi:GntR family transcriptional regulator [Bifidobacterium sp. 82T24]|uniref:GntR family transcriptional regulator n=1 Tax=Bifidobacterium pluvialisilvae TaxID=2834436 RepID=UPI001C564DE7|nr:GntR family transcriptional regulator [Bifidobacterium pluvialisilvae]MBW3088923.1 GntR family transcriptional regulator [Bifidobacterium pluvialisilvae]